MNNRQNAVMTRVLKESKTLNRGFSLIEMMVVLLIISIILAATAPIAAKKMARDMASGASAWIYTNNKGDVGYNVSGKDISAIIGTTKITNLPNGIKAPRLVLAGDTENPAFVFARRNGEYAGQINMTENQVTMNSGTGAVGANSVAMGMGQTHNGSEGTIAIGQGASVDGIAHERPDRTYYNVNHIAIGLNSQSKASGTIAIGPRARAFGIHSTAIGNDAWANSNDGGTGIQEQNDNGIAIGNTTRARGGSAIAIGVSASATGTQAIAIGDNASATNTHSIAIGAGVGSGTANEILLGDSSYYVYIPGNLVVDGTIKTKIGIEAGDNGITTTGGINASADIVSGGNIAAKATLVADEIFSRNALFYNSMAATRAAPQALMEGDVPRVQSYQRLYDSKFSDARLKNIGEKYASGLDALKKLDIYNYTFKNDKSKTPQVGVIAQDLEKVFPNSVTKDVYGYLRIRWDEMFYAVINAVKELDAKVSELSKNVQSYFDRTEKLEATIEAQQKTIDELKAKNTEFERQNKEFEKRLAKLEKKEK